MERGRWVGFCLAVVVGGCDTGPMVVGGDGGDWVTRGAASVAKRGCAGCHDPGDGSLSGRMAPLPGTTSYGANLTPDEETGLGGWSDDAIVTAIRRGLDDQWVPLCPPMPRFAIADDEARAVVAFLRALPSVRSEIPPSICAPPDPDTSGADAFSFPVPDGGAPILDGALAVPDAALPVPDAALAVPDAAWAVPDGALAVPDGALAVPDGALAVPDGALAVPDGAEALPDGATPADGALADGAARCGPRINEVQTAGDGGATDEFVELFNPCCDSIDLAGWHLVYRSSTGTKDVVLAPLAGQLAHGGFLVCAGHGFPGPAAIRFGNGLAADGGGLALRDGAGGLGDSLGWGKAQDGFVRGSVAPAPPSGKSIARLPDGHDAGDNGLDFAVRPATPGAANQ